MLAKVLVEDETWNFTNCQLIEVKFDITSTHLDFRQAPKPSDLGCSSSVTLLSA